MKKTSEGISIVVPFQCSDSNNQRAKNWDWLESYLRIHLPLAEIIVGKDRQADAEHSFSKSCSVNDGVKKSKGDIIVVLDADGYILAETILDCAWKIRKAHVAGHRLWFVPYRRFFRLTEKASKMLLDSNPRTPRTFSVPPRKTDVLDTANAQRGHWYGAGIQIFPREAFDAVSGWDERFRGWGGEDHAAMCAMDTLWWWHKTTPTQFLHIWHPMLSPTGAKNFVAWNERIWENQSSVNTNKGLCARYYAANGDAKRMRRLCDEWKTRDGDSKRD